MYTIYSIPNYKTTEKHIKSYRTHVDTIDNIVVMLEDKTQCYHEEYQKDKLLKINMDLDGIDIDMIEFDRMVKETMLKTFDVNIESAYTQNFSYNKGGNSHHYTISNYSAIAQDQIKLWKYIQSCYPDIDFKFDYCILSNTRRWFRLPNQYKEQSIGSEHVMIQGSIKDCINYHVTDCTDLTNIINEKFPNITEDEIIEQQVFAEIQTNSDQISQYADLINFEYLDKYESWMSIIWSIKSMNQEYINIARDISKKSPKYNSRSFKTLWDSYKPNGTISSKSFFHFCKISDEAAYTALNKIHKVTFKQKAESIVDNFFECDYTGIKVKTETSKYIYCDKDDNIKDLSLLKSRSIILCADMGKGKTNFIKQILKPKVNNILNDRLDLPELINYNILCVSSRKTFADFICSSLSRFHINNYLDLQSITEENSQRIVISAESLHKIPDNITYNYVIIDECESFFKQFSSKTMQKTVDSFNKIAKACINADKVIYADAFILNRSLDIIRSFTSHEKVKPIMIHNTKPANSRIAQQIDGKTFNKQVIEEIQNGKKIYVASASRSKLLTFQADANKANINGLYYEVNSPKLITATLKNVNQHWSDSNINVVATSPKITVGISHDVKEVFDSTYVYCKSTCTPRDLNQMTMRVRHLKEKKIHFALSRFNIHASSTTLQTHDDFQKQNLDTLSLLAHELKSYQNNIEDDGINDDNMTIKQLIKKLTKNNEILLKLLHFNQEEDAISNKYFDLMYLKILKLCNYDIQLIKIEDSKSEKAEKVEFDKLEEYNSIDTVLSKDIKALENTIKADNASPEDKLEVDKFYFNRYFNNEEFDEQEKAELFFDIYQNPYKRHIMYNLRIEKSNFTDLQLTQYDITKNELVCKLKMPTFKRRTIMELNKIMELEHSQDIKKISREQLQSTFKYLHDNISTIKSVFKSKISYEGDNYSTKSMLSLLRKIYIDWSDTDIKNGDLDRKGQAINYNIVAKPYYKNIKIVN
jgi:hypothetical protein